MTVPWRFILALPLGLLLGMTVFVGLLYAQLGVPTESTHWIFSIIQKKEMLAAKIPGPRLLIVSGSSALYGINAQLIERQTGCPTINLGSAAGLSLDYLLYRARKVARSGDTVLLVPEYELYCRLDNFSVHDDYILARDTSYFRGMSWLGKMDMAIRLPFKRIQKGLKNRRTPEHPNPPQAPYSPYTPITPGIDCLNDNGDEIFNTEATQPLPSAEMNLPVSTLKDGLFSEKGDGFTVLADFIQWAQSNHIRVLATFPNVLYRPEYEASNARQTIATITRFFAAHDVPVIGTAREAMLPSNQFYNTVYHLTYEAALKRTARLIPELKPYLHPPK